MRFDLHTHYYPTAYFERIERSGGDFSFATSPTGQTISALVSADDRADLAQGACFNDTGVEVGLA